MNAGEQFFPQPPIDRKAGQQQNPVAWGGREGGKEGRREGGKEGGRESGCVLGLSR